MIFSLVMHDELYDTPKYCISFIFPYDEPKRAVGKDSILPMRPRPYLQQNRQKIPISRTSPETQMETTFTEKDEYSTWVFIQIQHGMQSSYAQNQVTLELSSLISPSPAALFSIAVSLVVCHVIFRTNKFNSKLFTPQMFRRWQCSLTRGIFVSMFPRYQCRRRGTDEGTNNIKSSPSHFYFACAFFLSFFLLCFLSFALSHFVPTSRSSYLTSTFSPCYFPLLNAVHVVVLHVS